ncbi:MAG: hypothetical protein HKN92_10325, partial [Chitinophagales bacterium]|nr:hypothetical protein [Chitinophagales bacterium]
MKVVAKILLILLLTILIILSVSLILISTGVLNETIRRVAVSETNKILDGEISIGKIQGSLLNEFAIQDIGIIHHGDTLLEASALSIDYKIFKLLSKTVEVEAIRLDNFSLSAKEYEKDRWNILDLVPPTEDTSAAAPFNWKIILDKIWINKLSADIAPFDDNSSIPKKAQLSGLLGLEYDQDEIRIFSDSLSLTTEAPSAIIKNLTFNSTVAGDDVEWSEFILKLDKSDIRSDGSLSLANPLKSNISLSASPFDLSDIKAWIGSISGKPNIDIHVEHLQDKSLIDVRIIEGYQSAHLNGTVTGINSEPSYILDLNVDSLNGEYWTGDPSMRSLIVGDLRMNGSGLDIKENSFELNGAFGDVQYGEYTLDDLLLSLSKNKDKAEGELKLNSVMGKAETSFKLMDIFARPQYSGKMDLKNIDLAKILLDEKMNSDLNMAVAFEGKGFAIGKDFISLNVSSLNSSVLGKKIDKLNTSIRIDGTKYDISSFDLISPFANLKIRGTGDMVDRNNITYSVKLKDIETITSALELPKLRVEGDLTGNISGPAHSLRLGSVLKIADLASDPLYISNGQLDINTVLSLYNRNTKEFQSVDLKDMDLKIAGLVEKLTFEQYYARDIEIKADKSGQSADGSLDMQSSLGQITSLFKVKNLFSIPDYDASININRFDLSGILKNDSIDSDINLQLLVNGKGITPSDMILAVDVISEGSTIDRYEVGDFEAKLSYTKGLYQLSGLNIISPMATFQASGNGRWPFDNNVVFEFKVTDPQKLASAFDLQNMRFDGNVNGKLDGSTDSLGMFARVDLKDIKIDTMQITSSYTHIDLALIKNKPIGELYFEMIDTRLNESVLDSFYIQSRIDNDKIYSNINFSNPDSLSGRIKTILILGENTSILIPKMKVALNERSWNSGKDSASVIISSDSVHIEDF